MYISASRDSQYFGTHTCTTDLGDIGISFLGGSMYLTKEEAYALISDIENCLLQIAARTCEHTITRTLDLGAGTFTVCESCETELETA